MGAFLQHIANTTQRYVGEMPKAERKLHGQFFTGVETARFMASLFCVPQDKEELFILDAGAGVGTLSAALVERLQDEPQLKRLHLVCYETDTHVIPFLRENLEYLSAHCSIPLDFRLREENYILSQEAEYNSLFGADRHSQKYDLIIGNPPYMKIGKDAPEARAMRDVCYGAPNLYALFAAMGMFNMAEAGQMVYITPRSWTSGAYFRAFRKKLFSTCSLRHIHLFASREDVFDKEDVLQETMIFKVTKGVSDRGIVNVTTSHSSHDFNELTHYRSDVRHLVKGEHQYVYLITNSDEDRVVQRVSSCKKTLRDMGLPMKTGLTVDYREKDALRRTAEEGAIPLFFPHHIRHGKVIFPAGMENEYLNTKRASLKQQNVNYLFVKRFTTKEEARRLQCGVYLSRKHPEHSLISTQNKINFIGGMRELSDCIVYGLYVIFNSTLYDSYYRVMNGSTQVNSTEINSIPVPDIPVIEAMGKALIKARNMSETSCNEILARYV